MATMGRGPKLSLQLLAVGLLLLLSWGILGARATPVLRQLDVAMPNWPKGEPPLRVALFSDVHVGNLATNAARLTELVSQINEQRPDLVLIAGDFFPGEKPINAATATAALAPLKALRARLGVVAVPGNHDHWTGLPAVRAALAVANVTLLANQAERRGPIVIGAVDDAFSRHADVARVVEAVRSLPGPRLILTHSPDIAPELPEDFPLLLAGHTHCGQVFVPIVGSPNSGQFYIERYRCGKIVEGARTTIVTAGIGGSLPFRLGARPDWWLVTIGP